MVQSKEVKGSPSQNGGHSTDKAGQQESRKGPIIKKIHLRQRREMPKKPDLFERESATEIEREETMDLSDELRKLTLETGMPITQENGQRTFGPPKDWTGPPPKKGCEVFVGKLPRSVYEKDLVPLFGKYGKIYEIRLMMDFSGENRGFCFVQYTNPDDAQKAIDALNNHEIRKACKLGVVKSMDNCRLFIGGIPAEKTKQEIFQEMNKITDGVVKVIVLSDPKDKSKNRKYAFVEYENHKAAAMARRKLIPGKIPVFGVEVIVDWADPESEVDPEIMNKVKNLYVRNLSPSTTSETLEKIFNKLSDNGVESVKILPGKDFAFINFYTREQAETALEAFDKKEIDGSTPEVQWARPKPDNNHFNSKGSQDNSSSSSYGNNSNRRSSPWSNNSSSSGYGPRFHHSAPPPMFYQCPPMFSGGHGHSPEIYHQYPGGQQSYSSYVVPSPEYSGNGYFCFNPAAVPFVQISPAQAHYPTVQ